MAKNGQASLVGCRTGHKLRSWKLTGATLNSATTIECEEMAKKGGLVRTS